MWYSQDIKEKKKNKNSQVYRTECVITWWVFGIAYSKPEFSSHCLLAEGLHNWIQKFREPLIFLHFGLPSV